MALIAVIIADEFRTLKAANLKMSGEIAVLKERLNEAEARADDFEHRARGLNRLGEAEKKITEHDHRFSTMETELKIATAKAIMRFGKSGGWDHTYSQTEPRPITEAYLMMALGLVEYTNDKSEAVARTKEWRNKWLGGGWTP